MGTYNYRISVVAYRSIRRFYRNVAKKYSNTYSFADMQKDIEKAYNGIFKIENGLLRREPKMSRWKGLHMANNDKWYYAYTISEGSDGKMYVNVEDACHAQNIHDDEETNNSSQK